jgi:hypothetical protein
MKKTITSHSVSINDPSTASITITARNSNKISVISVILDTLFFIFLSKGT